MYDVVIVRFGELFLKSGYVKNRFQDVLIGSIRLRLESRGLKGRVSKSRDRIYVRTETPDEVADSMCEIFGIVSVSPAKEVPCAGIESMTRTAVEVAREVIREGDSFEVDVQRAGKHDFGSMDVEKVIGSEILRSVGRSCRVDLRNPDRSIHLEIREDRAFVFHEKREGFGGLPYNTQGKLVALVSSGIDSPVAAWFMMRRGCELVLVHFGDESRIKKVAKKLGGYADREMSVRSFPHDVLLKSIRKRTGKHTCIICKRIMLRFAEKLCEKEGAKGIVTGDSLGQVASQTLDNIYAISRGISVPVYRPLIGMDKQEIIRRARRIGTYAISRDKKGNEPCRWVPKEPATKIDIDKLDELERDIDLDGLVRDYVG